MNLENEKLILPLQIVGRTLLAIIPYPIAHKAADGTHPDRSIHNLLPTKQNHFTTKNISRSCVLSHLVHFFFNAPLIGRFPFGFAFGAGSSACC